jgi:hypothetical protein
VTQPITLTLARLRKLKPCNLEPHKPLFEGKHSVSVRQALEAGVSISDLLWVAGELDLKPQIVTFAAKVAREVAHLNPDPRVMAAIEAAEAWLREPNGANQEAAADAFDAAWAAAGAMWAAGAALPEQRIRAIFAEVFDPKTQETGR